MKNYYIIHGFMGSNIENWFPWLKSQIEMESNKLCVIPQFPISVDNHNYNSWKKLLDIYNYEYNMINEDTIIIGHSTGSIFALKYILETKTKINKLILISGFNNYYPNNEDELHRKLNPTYYIEDEFIKDISKYVKEIICIYGDNDPYITQDALHDFAKSINAKEVIIHNGGHLNEDAGYTKFDEILSEI